MDASTLKTLRRGLRVIGGGALRPGNISFGADQFDMRTSKGRSQLESFFSWCYFFFSIALVDVLTVVVYVQTNVSWVIGSLIPTICFVALISIFLYGRKIYVRKKPSGSAFVDLVKVLRASWRKRGQAVVQLSEVSRGAHKLNRMIETWSRRESFDGQSKDITKDLLKGALDLQESLILLGKLQDATKCTMHMEWRKESPWRTWRATSEREDSEKGPSRRRRVSRVPVSMYSMRTAKSMERRQKTEWQRTTRGEEWPETEKVENV